MKRLGVLLLAICRTIYCWIFLFWSLLSVDIVVIGIYRTAQSNWVDKGSLGASILFTAYSVVFAIAWWTILKNKLTSKRWAIAANLILIFTYVPTLIAGHWQSVLKAELDAWRGIVLGIFGIIIFSIPYHGWRQKSSGGAPLTSQ